MLVSDRNIVEDVGMCSLATSDYQVSMLDMHDLDALMYTKLDILGLDNIGIINDTCKLLNNLYFHNLKIQVVFVYNDLYCFIL